MIAEIIRNNCLPELLQKSRIHNINGYFGANKQLFIKRDDELGFGIGGTKTRKYASLLKTLIDRKFNHVIIEGSLNSNNVLGLIPLLKSYNIGFKLAIPKAHTNNIGNALWTAAMLKENDYILTSSTKGASNENYRDMLGTAHFFVVKEGACQIDSVPGLLSLPLEIWEYEQNANMGFDTIFIDAGTAISAIALLIGLKLLQSKTKVVVTQIADTENYFEHKLQEITQSFSHNNLKSMNIQNIDYELIKPFTAKSFGSINSSILTEWRLMMQEMQMPLDLTYTAKHFYSVKKYLAQHQTGNTLIINSGSWLAARNHSHLVS